MFTLKTWLKAARPMSWFVALAPALSGFAATLWDFPTHSYGAFLWPAALLMLMSLLFTIGVNYANDYSDGVKGADQARQGPVRLVGSGFAAPRTVRRVAIAFLAAGCVIGLYVCVAYRLLLFLVVGIALVALAWLYTAGSKAIAYIGLGEVVAFIVYGPIAVCGTELVLNHKLGIAAGLMSLVMGAMSAAVMAINNIRDRHTDAAHHKNTLAVRLSPASMLTLLRVLVFGIPSIVSLVIIIVWGYQKLYYVSLMIIAVAAGLVGSRFSDDTAQEYTKAQKKLALVMFIYAACSAVLSVLGSGGLG